MVTYGFVKFVINGVDYPGVASGDNREINFTITQDTTVMAVYDIANYILIISQVGQGEINPPSGSYPYPSNMAVTLTASPAQGWRFSHWLVDGSQVSTNPLILQMGSNHTVQAVFTQIAVRTLTIQNPVGLGTTNPEPNVYEALDGEVVQVLALPASGWQFNRWNGVSGGNPLNLTMNANYTIQAVFTEIPIPKAVLSVTVTGQASSPIAGNYEYNPGETAHLTAVPATGWQFDHWLLDNVTTITQASIDIPMNGDRVVSAVFTEIPPQDQLVATVGDYAVWISASQGSYYVKKGDAVVAQDFPTLQSALDWVNSQGLNLGALIPIGIVFGGVLLSGAKK